MHEVAGFPCINTVEDREDLHTGLSLHANLPYELHPFYLDYNSLLTIDGFDSLLLCLR